MTVRRRIDQLIAEPAVADLGYAPDQRLVATALVALRLLADEIDELDLRPSNSEPQTDEADDVGAQLADIRAQLKKLKKAVKKCSKKKKK